MNIGRPRLHAALALLLLTACSSAPTRVFTIEPVEAGAVIAYAGPPVRIDAVHVPPALDRTEILSDLGHGELRVHDTQHWSAPLGQLVRQALTADLAQRLPPGRVIFPHLTRTEETIGVSVDLLEFSNAAGGTQLTVGWAIAPAATTGAGGTPRWNTVTLRSRTTGERTTALTFSDLVAQLADRISADLAAWY